MRNSLGDLASFEALVDGVRQMAEHEGRLFDRLMEGVAPYVPQGLSTDEKRYLIDRLIAGRPDLTERAKRLAIFARFRSS